MRKTLLSSTAVGSLAAALGTVSAPAIAGAAHYVHLPAYTASYDSTTGGGLDWGPVTISNIPTFDSTTGNLQSVLVVENLTATLGGGVMATSTTTSATVTGVTSLHVTNGPAGMSGTPVLSLITKQSYNPSSTGDLEYYLSQSFAQGPVTTGNVGTGLPADPSWESVGPGTTSISFGGSTGGTSPSGVQFNPTVTETLSFQLTYTYTTSDGPPPTPTPEPASALLLGAGVLALGKLRKRRRG